MPNLVDGTQVRLIGVLVDKDPDDGADIAVLVPSTEVVALTDIASRV